MRVVAIGMRSFIAGFQLAGIEGREVKSPEEAFSLVSKLFGSEDVGLILLGSDLAKPIRDRLVELRSKKPFPLI